MRNPGSVTLSLTAVLATALFAALVTTGPVHASASAVADEQTQDILHMADGRVLTGEIVSETGDQIVFLFVDRNLNIQTRMTVLKRDVLHIERGVPLDSDEADDEEPYEGPSRTDQRTRGLAEGAATDTNLPSLYVIPMRGQMGTDIRFDVYTSIIDDIRQRRPDAVVWVLECRDVEDEVLAPLLAELDPRRREERGLFMIDDYRHLVQRLHDELRGIRQVLWVHDAYGVGAVMALAWPEMYMTPSARLVGMSMFFQEHGGDEDIKAKMREAWIGTGNGFLARGGHPPELGHGLMNPRVYLSASWEGRRVIWRNDLQGEVIISSRDDAVAVFNAKTAEDFGISRGTVETIDDLAMLLGFREYRVLEGDGLDAINRYKVAWRREFERAWKRFMDFRQHMGWASGDQAIRWLGQAVSDLEFIVNTMRRYPAVEVRLRMRGLPDRLTLEMQIEQLRRRIADMQRGRGGRGGGGGGRTR